MIDNSGCSNLRELSEGRRSISNVGVKRSASFALEDGQGSLVLFRAVAMVLPINSALHVIELNMT
jgi:hypothetical protein